MKISIFLLCYNEELMLPYTITHYKKMFPSATITIFDNHSTDSSCEIAESNGCNIVKFDSNEQQDENLFIWIRTHLWKKYVTDGWVIMCDMDEWLSLTEDELQQEDTKGTTIITTKGFNMVGESKQKDYSDINLFDITKGYHEENMSKRICFKYPDVITMEYWYGAHQCFPQGRIVYSEKVYMLKHYDILGEQYLIDKYYKRYQRNELSRSRGCNHHYILDNDKVVSIYNDALAKSVVL